MAKKFVSLDRLGTFLDQIKDLLTGKSNVGHTHTKSEVGLGNVDNTADSSKNVATANYPYGFYRRPSSQGWGNQDGDFVTGWQTSNGAEIQFRQKNGALNTIIDGYFYQAEGKNKVLDTSNVDSALSSTSTNPVQNKAINSALAAYIKGLSVSGKTITITKGDGTTSTQTTQDTTYSAATTSANGLMSSADKTKLDGVATGANNYTHPTTSGNKHIPSGGSSGQILRWSADGTAAWGADNNTTYSAATTSAAGLMSAADKTKLGATNIGYATCSTAAATPAKEATIIGNDNWTLAVGAIVCVKFSYSNSNSASNCTLNVNGTGAKQFWWSNAVYTGTSAMVCGYANRYHYYMYDGTYWVWMGKSSDDNSTYSPMSLGGGYGTCATAEATTAKVATLASYSLVKGGKPVIKFTYAVPASATLNINSIGAKAIYYKGAAITAGVIAAGDTVTFIYDGSYYHVLAIDKAATEYVKSISISGKTVTITKGDGSTSTQTTQDTNTTYSAATTSAAGLMSAADKTKLDGVASGANAYSLPTATDSVLGGVKVGSNITNSSGTISLTKTNVTSALGYTPPTTNTTYSAATTSANGLMSSTDKSKLDGIATGATKVTVDSALSSSSTNPVQNKVVNSALSAKTTRLVCWVGSNAANSNGWYKVATETMSAYYNTTIMFAVASNYSNYGAGILLLQMRADNSSIWCPRLGWLTRNGLAADSVICVVSGMTYTIYVNLTATQWGGISFEVLTNVTRTDTSSGITLINSRTKESAAPTATVTSSDLNAQLDGVETLLAAI